MLASALCMGGAEQTSRMRAMRSVVAESNTYWWAGQMLQDAARLRAPRGAISKSSCAIDGISA